MGMFRSGDNGFLLCYNGKAAATFHFISFNAAPEFGVYVDRHGDPNRPNGIIEWEGTAERVAFHPPYVVIFDSRFIEVRHIDHGQLVQIIRGTDIRCIWDGRAGAVTSSGTSGWDQAASLKPRIHAVWRSPDTRRSNQGVIQTVLELVPTVPLFLPQTPSTPLPLLFQGEYFGPQR